MSTYQERLPGRHLDTSNPLDWLSRHLNPPGFLQWMLVICLCLVLWPASYGGRLGMVMVAGTSMEPAYELGDAVITWRETIDVGDVILYRVPQGVVGAGAPVIHRVVGGDGNGWVTQGDNTPFPDDWYPTNLDVLGVAKMKIPLGGEILAIFRSWWFIAAMGGAAIGLLLWPDSDAEERRRGRHRA